MDINSLNTFDKKQFLKNINLIRIFFTGIIINIYSFSIEVKEFVKRVNNQSKLIEEIKGKDIELETLKQKISTFEANIENIEVLKKKMFECQCNIVLLQRGKKVLKITPS